MPKILRLMPPSLNGKQFEELCLFESRYWESRPLHQQYFTMGRYGVQVSVRTGQGGKPEYIPIQSLPDFEGIIRGQRGRQFIFDCKTCSQSSFGSKSLEEFQKRQMKHMLRRQSYGAICFLLIHFNERVLKTKKVLSATYAIPFDDKRRVALWEPMEAGEIKSITLPMCEEWGIPCEWWRPEKATQVRPKLKELLEELEVT